MTTTTFDVAGKPRHTSSVRYILQVSQGEKLDDVWFTDPAVRLKPSSSR